MKLTKLFTAVALMAGTTFAYAGEEVAQNCGPCARPCEKPCSPCAKPCNPCPSPCQPCAKPCQPCNPCGACCPTCVPECCVDECGNMRALSPAEQAMKKEAERRGRYGEMGKQQKSSNY